MDYPGNTLRLATLMIVKYSVCPRQGFLRYFLPLQKVTDHCNPPRFDIFVPILIPKHFTAPYPCRLLRDDDSSLQGDQGRKDQNAPASAFKKTASRLAYQPKDCLIEIKKLFLAFDRTGKTFHIKSLQAHE